MSDIFSISYMATRNEMPSFKVLNFPTATPTTHADTPYRAALLEPVGPGVGATASESKGYTWQNVKLAILEKAPDFLKEKEPREGSPEAWERKFNEDKLKLASDAVAKSRLDEIDSDKAKKCISISSKAMEARDRPKLDKLRGELDGI